MSQTKKEIKEKVLGGGTINDREAENMTASRKRYVVII